jgi:hypothetical protein
MDLHLAQRLCVFSYYFYLKKIPIIGRIDIVPYIEETGFDVLASDFVDADYIYIAMKDDIIVFGMCSSFIRLEEWFGEGGNFDVFPAEEYKGHYYHNGLFDSSKKLMKHAFMDAIRAFYRDGKRIVLTGHSRGAGVMSCLAVQLFGEYNMDVEVYTFGEPPSLGITTKPLPAVKKYRFVTKSDMIPGFGLDKAQHWGDVHLLLNDICCNVPSINYPNTQQINIYAHLPSKYLNDISGILGESSYVGLSSFEYYLTNISKSIVRGLEYVVYSLNGLSFLPKKEPKR